MLESLPFPFCHLSENQNLKMQCAIIQMISQPKLYISSSSTFYYYPFYLYVTGTLISVGYDNVTPSQYPGTWNLKKVFFMASVLAAVALSSSLLLLCLCLNSWDHNSVLKMLGLGKLTYGQITTVIYLKVSVSDFLTLFSARTHDGFFWSSMPSPILLIAAIFALSLSTIISCVWPASTPDGIEALGLGYKDPKTLALFVWIYCILWWFVQDICKVMTYQAMERNNIFGVNDSSGLRRNAKSLAATSDDHISPSVSIFIDEIDEGNEGRNPLFTEDYKNGSNESPEYRNTGPTHKGHSRLKDMTNEASM
jgi:hypothetical protein